MVTDKRRGDQHAKQQIYLYKSIIILVEWEKRDTKCTVMNYHNFSWNCMYTDLGICNQTKRFFRMKSSFPNANKQSLSIVFELLFSQIRIILLFSSNFYFFVTSFIYFGLLGFSLSI
jgi:hypothetical protein